MRLCTFQYPKRGCPSKRVDSTTVFSMPPLFFFSFLSVKLRSRPPPLSSLTCWSPAPHKLQAPSATPKEKRPRNLLKCPIPGSRSKAPSAAAVRQDRHRHTTKTIGNAIQSPTTAFAKARSYNRANASHQPGIRSTSRASAGQGHPFQVGSPHPAHGGPGRGFSREGTIYFLYACFLA